MTSFLRSEQSDFFGTSGPAPCYDEHQTSQNSFVKRSNGWFLLTIEVQKEGCQGVYRKFFQQS